VPGALAGQWGRAVQCCSRTPPPPQAQESAVGPPADSHEHDCPCPRRLPLPVLPTGVRRGGRRCEARRQPVLSRQGRRGRDTSGTLGNRGCHPNSPARRGGAAGALDDVDRAQHRHHAVMPAGVRGRLPSAPVSRETGGLAHDVGREASLEPSREPGRLRARGLVRTPVEREVPATCADQSQPTPAIPIIPPTDQKVGGSRVFVVGAGDRSPSGVLSPSNARLSASRAAASTCVPRLRAQPRIARTRRRSF